MTFNLPQSQITNLGSEALGASSLIALVERVILNIDDIDFLISEYSKFYNEIELNDYITKDGSFYGSIIYRLISGGTQSETDEEHLTFAQPLSKNFLTLPVIGEIVNIHILEGKSYYEKISYDNSPNYDTNIRFVLTANKSTKEQSQNSTGINNYQSTQQTGIANSDLKTNKSETVKNGFAGVYFKRNLHIHQLALNEGDTLLQGRFGNSIRFSGYIHDDKNNGVQYPAILIRNGESNKNQQKKVYDVVSEDINEDGTSIQITSGKYKTLYDSTTIKVNKEANDTYPSSDQLIGDQIVVNSGRVILSSKTAETFLFSKKKFSIFTDDIVTIDTEKGYKLISQNGNIEITAKGNKNIIMTVNSGSKIFYGKDAADQQAILGTKMVDLLGQLIDSINAMKFATPSGPTSPGPIDKVPFNNIKNQLKDTLSKINYLI